MVFRSKVWCNGRRPFSRSRCRPWWWENRRVVKRKRDTLLMNQLVRVTMDSEDGFWETVRCGWDFWNWPSPR